MTNETKTNGERTEAKEGSALENLTLKILNGALRGENFFAGRNVIDVVNDAGDLVELTTKLKTSNPKIVDAMCTKYQGLSKSYFSDSKGRDNDYTLGLLYDGAYKVLTGTKQMSDWKNEVDKEDDSVWKKAGLKRSYDSVWENIK
ncbi:MAG: hypothetical protein WCK29_03635 [archaeon]